MTDRELMQMALDALEHLQTDIEWQYKSPTRAMLRKVEKSLRARLAQPEQEPVAKYSDIISDGGLDPRNKFDTAPPQRKWQGLTDEEIRNEANHHVFDESFFSGAVWARGKIKEKNNG